MSKILFNVDPKEYKRLKVYNKDTVKLNPINKEIKPNRLKFEYIEVPKQEWLNDIKKKQR